jgi:peptidoglycan L-alanyl-D-glutamate endopeptidase CwlK
MSRDIKDLHFILSDAYPKAEAKFKELYPNLPQPFRTCTYRSNEEQEQLFLQKPKVTNAKAGESPHNYIPSMAFDIAFIGVNKKLDWNKDLFLLFANILKDIEPRIEWGGSWSKFKDAPHFQLFNWKNYKPVKTM